MRSRWIYTSMWMGMDKSIPASHWFGTAETNPFGIYNFNDLTAGIYLVDVAEGDPNLPIDGFGNPYRLTTGNDPLQVDLADGEVYLSVDFGFADGRYCRRYNLAGPERGWCAEWWGIRHRRRGGQFIY